MYFLDKLASQDQFEDFFDLFTHQYEMIDKKNEILFKILLMFLNYAL